MMAAALAAVEVSMRFGGVLALDTVTLEVHRARVTCLLGDNGAGKSTLIRILSGVQRPTSGQLLLDGSPLELSSPRDARGRGISTVYQDLALAPLMSVWRNFVLGAEPLRGFGPFRRLDVKRAQGLARQTLDSMGIELPDLSQSVDRLSGGQRQAVAIARAVYFGARVLILDEPTASLGVRQAGRVLETITRAAQRGLAVLLVTHNPAHAHRVGDSFTLLRHGRVANVWTRGEISEVALAQAMAATEESGEPNRLPPAES
jgi:simple sugar transport system ATP-binding protein